MKKKGIIYIQSTRNNTIVTLTDLKGNTKHWASGGTCGYTKSRRSTSYAAHAAAKKVAIKAISLGVRFVNVRTKGPFGTRGKRSALKGLKGLRIANIQDTTNLPHNGCRLSKKRRT